MFCVILLEVHDRLWVPDTCNSIGCVTCYDRFNLVDTWFLH